MPARSPVSMNLPARSPALRTCPPVVQHMWSTSYVPPRTRRLKCEHETYEPTSLVSPLESNKIWTSLLISSRVHHHPWTYPLMAQHLMIQVYHHCLKATHTATNCNSIAWRNLSKGYSNRIKPQLLSNVGLLRLW